MSVVTWQQPRIVAVMGNPNTGKSSLFNALTGLRQKVGNYPGVTVERHTGSITLPEGEVMLVDVPGTYSLAAHSPDEMVAVDVLAGHFADVGQPEAIVVVVDASNLRRNLYLATQLLEMDMPVVIALNMVDVATANGVTLDVPTLSEHLQAPVIPMVASKRKGIETMRDALSKALTEQFIPRQRLVPQITEAAQNLANELDINGRLEVYALERSIIDVDGYAEKRVVAEHGEAVVQKIESIRTNIGGETPLSALEARRRYDWINQLVDRIETRIEPAKNWVDSIDHLVSHPVIGMLLFVVVMATVFQAVFSWAAPLMDMIDGAILVTGNWLTNHLPEGALTSLLVDGVVAGVGSVIIFLPQILVLFALIILLEDTGYMARAAFLMDRFMRLCGLSGQSFIPMLSSFACAVPGVMATRVIPDDRDRLVTILAAPFMTCSARLPVYALLIAAFIPQQHYFYGWLNLQGLVLLGLYLLGILGGIFTAWLLKKTLLQSDTPSFLMELPPYRLPNLKSVLYRLWDRAQIFLKRAGTVIFTIAVIIWALAYFPHPQALHDDFEQQRAQVDADLVALDNQEAAAYLDQSYLGLMGKAVVPIFSPLGWDWKISAAVIASFPAREVVIAVLGTIYAVGSDVDEEDASLIQRLKSATHPDGRLVFTLPMVLGLLIFYAFCLQCVATVVVIRRESNSWRWPIFAWVYMTTLGYVGALLVFQLLS